MNQISQIPPLSDATVVHPHAHVPAGVAVHPLRSVGPKYAPHDASAPLFEGRDVAGLVAGTIITLGPLAAVALGL